MQLVAFLVVIAVLAIAFAQWWFSAEHRIRRSLSQAERVAIAHFPVGIAAKIVGRILDGDTVSAPLTGRTCVFYEAIVEEYRSSGKSGYWRTIIREMQGVPFLVDDGTGRALVDPRDARLAVDKDSTTRSGTFDDASAVEQEFLDRHGMTSRGAFFNKTLRYREGAFEVGETVAVSGFGLREPDPDGQARITGYRDAPTRVRISNSPKTPLMISDFEETHR